MTKRTKLSAPEPLPAPEPETTPAMKRSTAERALLKALGTSIRLILETNAVKKDDEWVDQNSSPLGKFGHLQAVKQGRLPWKHGRRVLVRRADLNSFLAHHSVRPRADGKPDSPEFLDPEPAKQVSPVRPDGKGGLREAPALAHVSE